MNTMNIRVYESDVELIEKIAAKRVEWLAAMDKETELGIDCGFDSESEGWQKYKEAELESLKIERQLLGLKSCLANRFIHRYEAIAEEDRVATPVQY